MTSNIPAITIEDLHIIFRQRRLFRSAYSLHALKGTTFTVNEGDSLAVIGRNGAGKSTLLRVIAGVLEPDKGEVVVHGNKSVGLLALGLGIFPECSGRANIIMQLMLQRGITRKEAEEMVDPVIEYAGLRDAIDMPLRKYSNGMGARLKFAIATQTSPDILLVDEVLSVGDQPFKEKSLETMRQTLKSDKTVVFVSHAINEIKQLCNRVVWIEHGNLIMDGETEPVLEAYLEYCKEQRALNK
jgi:ABC-type polysaccharide/polyol phosphate transport system ATPase subunit